MKQNINKAVKYEKLIGDQVEIPDSSPDLETSDLNQKYTYQEINNVQTKRKDGYENTENLLNWTNE